MDEKFPELALIKPAEQYGNSVSRNGGNNIATQFANFTSSGAQQQLQIPQIMSSLATTTFVSQIDANLDLTKEVDVQTFFTSTIPTHQIHANSFCHAVDREKEGPRRLLVATGVPIDIKTFEKIVPNPGESGATRRLIDNLLQSQWKSTSMSQFQNILNEKLDFKKASNVLAEWREEQNKKVSEKMAKIESDNEKTNEVRGFIMAAFHKAEYDDAESRIKPIMDVLGAKGVKTVKLLLKLFEKNKKSVDVLENTYQFLFPEHDAIYDHIKSSMDED